jgi:hypothetical protein
VIDYHARVLALDLSPSADTLRNLQSQHE